MSKAMRKKFMQSQTIITFLIIVCKIIIAILLYSLIRKNRMLKQEKLKLLETNLKLNWIYWSILTPRNRINFRDAYCV